MATYTPVDRHIPSGQRTALITAVSAGDEIDFREILGRPARGMTVVASAATDIVGYRLVSYWTKKTHSNPDIHRNQIFDVFGVKSPQWTLTEETAYTGPFTNTGASFTLQQPLSVEAFVVDTLTGPATVEIVIW